MVPTGVTLSSIMHNGRVKIFPDGRTEVLASPRCMFREPGWELADDWGQRKEVVDDGDDDSDAPVCGVVDAADRARRRARSAVRDLAFSNDFDVFCTFTLDAAQIDRYDPAAVVKKLNVWLDNRVRRKGLFYVMVPELHKDGALHVHALMNSAALDLTDSGTMSNGGRPRRPRSRAERERMAADGWHVVYNLPEWTLGFSTAIMLYGDRAAAVSYVCKYVSKQDRKIGGRWYYSGGSLRRPDALCVDIDYDAFAQEHSGNEWTTDDGKVFCRAVIEEGEDSGH